MFTGAWEHLALLIFSTNHRDSMTSRSHLLAIMLFFGATGAAAAEDCGQERFSAVVNEARGQLQALIAENRQIFQEKLARIKEQAKLTDADFLAQGRALIEDDKIAAFDRQHEELVAKIPGIGRSARSVASLAGVAPSMTPSENQRCVMLDELRGIMGQVVENTRAKWSYLQDKTDAALAEAKPDQEAK